MTWHWVGNKSLPWQYLQYLWCHKASHRWEGIQNAKYFHVSLTTFRTQRVYSSPPAQNGHHFEDNMFKCIFWNKNIWISNKISLKDVPWGQIDNMSALGQIMTWRRSGDKPLSETMLTQFTNAYWVNAQSPSIWPDLDCPTSPISHVFTLIYPGIPINQPISTSALTTNWKLVNWKIRLTANVTSMAQLQSCTNKQYWCHCDGSVEHCGISSVLVMEIQIYCTNNSKCHTGALVKDTVFPVYPQQRYYSCGITH